MRLEPPAPDDATVPDTQRLVKHIGFADGAVPRGRSLSAAIHDMPELLKTGP